ncbi:MAG TPA: glycoside hydrolase family 36 protein [Verrucomicrobiae bacterium]
MNTRHTLALLLALSAFLLTARPGWAANYRLQLLEGENVLLDRARQRGSSAGVVVTEQTPERVVFSESKVVVSAERHGPGWNALWSGRCPAGIYGATFSAEIDGERLLLSGAESSLGPFRDGLGQGQELRQVWLTNGVRVERELRVYDGLGTLTIGGRIGNQTGKDLVLGTANNVELGTNGWWQLGPGVEAPAAIFIQGHSLLQSLPFASSAENVPPEQQYSSSGVLALASRTPPAILVAGFVRADEASPVLSARFRRADGGARLTAASRFIGRRLRAGETVELNRLYIAAEEDAFRAMEVFGEAMARCSAQPVRTGPTGLWCSWYAHRMGMTEEKVLANAEVAARHFRPVGLEIMQLDHGWQRGDITGDWVCNERFPHGLRWLADQLRERHGLRLGVWIAPTDVAETSEVFRQHPDWMLKGADGKPLVNWKWYWKPNPNCYELDATHPDAARYIVDSFRRLTEQGVSYYKIDFIASAAGEHFVQHDPCSTRGWSVLRRAMETVRAGAGERAWIRYCQTPPVLGAGLADSTIGGGDTLDAGVPGRFDVLRENAGALAAGWWLNDRPYHREVCDMSVRMQGSLEEVRVRAALMTLAGCSISWSDELSYLPASRIRLMQQCMPPGNPPMRPLDLFERDLPSIWHLRATNSAESWDVVGFFNLNPQPERRAIRFEQLGLNPNAEYLAFEFWEEKFLGRLKTGLDLLLPPESSRIVSIRPVASRPRLIGTDMHVLQGVHEIRRLQWDAATGALSGLYHRMPGITGKAFFYLPKGWYPKFDFPLSPASARLTHLDGPIWMQEIEFAEADFGWTLPFEPPKPPPAKEPAGPGTNP